MWLARLLIIMQGVAVATYFSEAFNIARCHFSRSLRCLSHLGHPVRPHFVLLIHSFDLLKSILPGIAKHEFLSDIVMFSLWALKLHNNTLSTTTIKMPPSISKAEILLKARGFYPWSLFSLYYSNLSTKIPQLTDFELDILAKLSNSEVENAERDHHLQKGLIALT